MVNWSKVVLYIQFQALFDNFSIKSPSSPHPTAIYISKPILKFFASITSRPLLCLHPKIPQPKVVLAAVKKNKKNQNRKKKRKKKNFFCFLKFFLKFQSQRQFFLTSGHHNNNDSHNDNTNRANDPRCKAFSESS